MTTLAPEKPTGTRCGEMIQSGIVAYPCELAQGHAQIPEDDPEPHYCVEIGRIVRAWQAWKQRQLEREQNPSISIIGGVNCSNCGSALTLSDSGDVALCVKACGAEPIPVAQPQQAKTDWPFGHEFDETVEEGVAASGTADHGSGGFITQKPGKNAAWEDVTDLARLNAGDYEDYACPRTIVHPHHFWGLKGEVPVYQCKGDLTDPPAVAQKDPAFAAEDSLEDGPALLEAVAQQAIHEAADGSASQGLRDFVATHQSQPHTSAYDEDMPDDGFVAPDPPRYPSWLIFDDDSRPDAEMVGKITQSYDRLMEAMPPEPDEILTIAYSNGTIRTRMVPIHDPAADLDQTVVMPEGVAGDVPPEAVRQTRVWQTPDLDPLNLPRVEGCGKCEEIKEDPHPGLATWIEFVVNHFDREHDIVLTETDEGAGWVDPEPTKQREGDQPLPEGGVACVQDRIIEEMEESKRVGMVRYGSHLMTFNGRDSLLDAAEEARDLHVYLTQIRMEAEATRAQLEAVVASRIRPLASQPFAQAEEAIASIATLAVDAMMGWVLGQNTSALDLGTPPAG